MNGYLVYYKFYYEDINNPDHPVESINVKISYVYGDDEEQAKSWLMDYFGAGVVEIMKAEKLI